MPRSRKRHTKSQPVQQVKRVQISIEPDGIDKLLLDYKVKMREVQRRLAAISSIIFQRTTTGFAITDRESVAINFRKIVELIVFANLACHEKEYSALYPKYKNEWRAKEIMTRLKQINEYYYPSPKKITNVIGRHYSSDSQTIEANLWMSENELIDMYNQCSGLIHEGQEQDFNVVHKVYVDKFFMWHQKLTILLSHHWVVLPKAHAVIACNMRTGVHGLPQTWWLENVTDKVVKQ